MPWSRLKYRLAQSNLARHLGAGSFRILDAGGGNGLSSIPLAEQGHSVDIVDYSTEMLADAGHRVAQTSTTGRVTLHRADLSEVSQLFKGQLFDVVLCHNVMQYVTDVPGLFRDLISLLKPGGLISLIGVNRYSIPYDAAFKRGDLADALAKLDARSVKAYIFDATFTAYTGEEVGAMLREAGCVVEQDYGIRCICDYWGNNELKFQPEVFERIERLEFALTDKHPYKLLARYFQVIARKRVNVSA